MELMAVIAGCAGMMLDRDTKSILAAVAAVDMAQWDEAATAAEVAVRMDQAAMGIKTDSMVEVAGLDSAEVILRLVYCLA